MESSTFHKCAQEAIQKGTELFPVDCIEILEKHYKGRMELMTPDTISKKVVDLMGVITDNPDMEEVKRATNRWLNS